MGLACVMRTLLLLAALIAVAAARYRPTPGGFAWESCMHRVRFR